MKELSDLLREIKKSNEQDDMEFGEDFAKLQTIFNTANQFVRQFDKIVFDGGNEMFIVEIVARMVRCLRRRRYLDEEHRPVPGCEHQLRKITFYLVLNTDATFKYDLSRDTKICQVLNTIPLLSKCLLINCIWGANLDAYFYEIIRYTPQWFSMQFLDQAVTSLKYAKPYELLDRIGAIGKAIYYSICRTDHDWRPIDRNRFVEQQRTQSKLFDTIAEMLRHFNTPDLGKFAGWSRFRNDRYHGFVVKQLLEIILYGLDLYFNRSLFEVDAEMAIYELMGERHVPRSELPEQYSSGTDSHLMKINMCLLNTLQSSLMDVTVDTFMNWVEIDVKDSVNEEKMTLQQVIGEYAFKLVEIMREHKIVQHTVLNQLNPISMRPKSLAERAMDMSMRELMERMEETPDPYEEKMFFNELVRRGDLTLGNSECLDLIEKHISVVSGDNVRKMLEYDNRPRDENEMVTDDAEEDEEEPEETIKLRKIILESVPYLLFEESTTLIKFMIGAYGLEYNRYRSPTFATEIIEFMNRFKGNASPQQTAADDDDDDDSIPMRLIFQWPSAFYQRLTRPLHDSSFDNATYIAAIVRIIARTRTLALPYMSAQLRKLVTGPDFELVKSKSLPTLIRRLFELDLFENNHLLQGCLLAGADEAFRTSNWIACLEIVKVMNVVLGRGLNIFKLDTLKQVVLKMAELSERLRFDVTALQPEHPQGIERVTLLEQTLKTIPGPARTLRGLRDQARALYISQVEGFRPITRYYLQKSFVDAAIGKTVLPLSKFLFGPEIDESTAKTQVRLQLSKTLVQCTAEEARKLAKDPLLLPHMHDAVLTILVLLTEFEHHYECLKNCLSNYLCVVLDYILPSLLTPESDSAERATLVKSLMKLIVKLPDRTRERILNAISFGLAAIVHKLRTVDSSLDMGEIEKVIRIDSAEYATALHEHNGTSKDLSLSSESFDEGDVLIDEEEGTTEESKMAVE